MNKISAETVALLIVKLGIPLAETVLKNLNGANTIDEAIAALGNIKSAQAYVDADAAERGVPAAPLLTETTGG